MKRSILLGLLLISVVPVVVAQTGRASAPRVEKAVVEFPQQVKLLDVFLKGTYLFVHDEGKMANGETCSYVYEWIDGKQGKLVTSFHCNPIARERAETFVIKTNRLGATFNDLIEVTEYQFGGSTEGHRIPKA
jgi:hypothetical protein